MVIIDNLIIYIIKLNFGFVYGYVIDFTLQSIQLFLRIYDA